MTLITDFRTRAVRHNRAVWQTPESRLQNVGLHHPERPAEATSNQTCVECREKVNKYLVARPGTALKKSTVQEVKDSVPLQTV